jgi:XRE family aerobic/anaerobic benzoate catabolism transcriptional regulator
MSGQEEPLTRVLGKRIRKIRISRGLSREMLAARLGLSSRDLQRYERGTKRMRPGLLLRIVAALEVRLSDIFADERPSAATAWRTMCPRGRDSH